MREDGPLYLSSRHVLVSISHCITTGWFLYKAYQAMWLYEVNRMRPAAAVEQDDARDYCKLHMGQGCS